MRGQVFIDFSMLCRVFAREARLIESQYENTYTSSAGETRLLMVLSVFVFRLVVVLQ